MSAASKVACIIPYFRAPEKLEKCRAAIKSQTHLPCEAFVRDNSDDNILFTAAVNEGLRKYVCDPSVQYVIILNQDAYMEPDCVKQLVAFLEENPACGIACPLQYEAIKEPGRWGGLSDPLSFSRTTRHTYWGGSLQAWPLGSHRTDPIDSYEYPFETFWANGACMMLRMDMVREVGMFDRNMRFICSDSDFSFTARARGWKVFVVPQALVQHAAGASGSVANPEIELVKLRDVEYFTRKWLTGDLYRELALEGDRLAHEQVRETLAKFQAARQQLEEELADDEED
ncbi:MULTISPECIES: glycosyltransferase family 2 protein [Ramlibacter]|uniref:Glycosyltransferase family 2 protein n=1 Tax=Ramlibacter aquaticus TaxID=2780094 RepID=A0ABR9SFR7_9BURK|nr:MULTISPECIES: glycosyltransferase family 2 protein [Ramlibacter]MBE7941161.1 glycosyltransferase family 2 protein [Ramlibacter aquaticus]